MATRFYFPSSGTPNITPTAPAGWSETTGFDILVCSPNKRNTAMTSKTRATSLTAQNSKVLLRQYVSDPLLAQTISGTIKGTVRCLESGVNDNVDVVTAHIWLASNDGQTSRGDILAIGNYGPVLEFDTVLEAKRIADGDTITSQTAQYGDRIIIELGYSNSAGSGTSISASMSFGDNSAADLADNETDQTASNPFVEFSQTLLMLLPLPNNYQFMHVGDGMSTGEKIR